MPASGPWKPRISSANTGTVARVTVGMTVGVDHDPVDLGAQSVENMLDERPSRQLHQWLVATAETRTAAAGQNHGRE